MCKIASIECIGHVPQKVGGQKGLYTQMVKATHNEHDQSRIKKHDTQIVAEIYNNPASTWETKFSTAYEQIARLLLIKNIGLVKTCSAKGLCDARKMCKVAVLKPP